MRVVGRLGVGGIRGGRLVRRWGVVRQGRWAAWSRRRRRRPDGQRLGAVERQMGEVRCLARAEPPPPPPRRGGRVGLAADAVRDSRCNTDGGKQRPPPGEGPSGGPGSRGGSAADREPGAGATAWTSRGA